MRSKIGNAKSSYFSMVTNNRFYPQTTAVISAWTGLWKHISINQFLHNRSANQQFFWGRGNNNNNNNNNDILIMDPKNHQK